MRIAEGDLERSRLTREAMDADFRAAEERVVKVRSEVEQVVEQQKKDMGW